MSPPWYLRKAVLLLKAGGVCPVQRWQRELRIQHIQTVSLGRQRCWGLLQAEFVAAVTSDQFKGLARSNEGCVQMYFP